ncbi:cell surface protein [Bifidobacterium saguinibicoloris]|uniref:cell surface protein n=1 Tax=Bifidobacterium saguinibicoloris TaxID=2834433 RepID=UPI001C5A0688|nr:cell surface protein [Bifidobacterium saguinibicoloris]MBW3081295.1 cell surface protein [Bifidobacterium saguinibicoloris]
MTAPSRRLAAVVALFAAIAMTLGITPAASAASLAHPPNGTYLVYKLGTKTLYLGAIAIAGDGRLVYCMEAGKDSDYSHNGEQAIGDSDAVRKLAWLADRYQGSRDAVTHAAIGFLVHREIDANTGGAWTTRLDAVRRQHGDAPETRAAQLWEEANANVPVDANVDADMTDGIRAGWVDARVTAASGAALAGVPYALRIQGPAEFVGNDGALAGKRVDGVTGTEAKRHAWRATGEGEVQVFASYDHPQANRVDSAQDFLTFGGQGRHEEQGVSFRVRKEFTPAVTTVASAKIVDAGQPVSDKVTSTVTGEDSHWPAGLELTAHGYYFDSIPSGRLVDRMQPKKGETVEEFLGRIERRGYTPAAWGETTFTGPGQTQEVTAHAEDGGEYRAPGRGGIGTWVWVFDQSRQSDEARPYVAGDSLSAFLDQSETNSNRAKVEVESSVTEHTAHVGSHLSDTITVGGFPDDHGLFAGDEAYGIGADEPLAQVSVWWAGDPSDPSNDAAYKPSGAEPPAGDDANHRLVGTWEYPAVNGVIRVGGGAADAHGNPVEIVAESHGWYVFVWSFKGDDRVMPASSRYDDQWEMTYVDDEPDEPEEEEPEEEEPEEEEPEEPEEPLPATGTDVAVGVGASAALIVAGGVMIVVVRRRRELQDA